jgi:hypothetical protein
VGHTSRSSGLVHMEASLDRVSESGLKTDGGVTTVGWCMWHHYGGYVGGKLKTDGSMR